MRIILASKSLTRGRSLEILGLEYEKIPSNFDERSIQDDNPHELARKLSEAKARKVGEEHSDAVIIAGDLFVVLDHKIYGKPKTEEEAYDMLKKLSGKHIEIISGLAVFNAKNDKMLSTSKTCTVKFRNFLDEEIKTYISRYPVVKFAAAFEGDFMIRFAEHVEGSYNFATGLPNNELSLFLREHGVNV